MNEFVDLVQSLAIIALGISNILNTARMNRAGI